MLWLWILLIVLAVLLAALCGAAWYFFKLSILRGDKERTEEDFLAPDNETWGPVNQRMKEAQAWMRERGEMVSIQSFDGLRLAAFYIPADVEKPKGTLIVFHGYRSLATVDFAPEVQFLHDLGYRLLVPYQRSHGLSEGKYICYGVLERFDARDWAKYADSRWPGEDIFLSGISMGCATVTMAADLDLPAGVRGIIADCGFTTPWDIMAYLLKKQYHLPAFPLVHLVDLLARAKAGFALKGADSREALSNTRLPVLFLHGAADDFVPVFMTQENFAACRSEKELVLVEGAGHAQSFALAPALCQEKMAAFLGKYGSAG